MNFLQNMVASLILSFLFSLTLFAADPDGVASTNEISTALTNSAGIITNSIGTNSFGSDTNMVTEELEASGKEVEGEVSPQKTNTFSGEDLASFKIISDRNIFNMNRSLRSSGRRPTRETRRPVKTESFALVGTLKSDKGEFAFFDGSSSDYRKAIKVEDTIAGYKLTQIDNNAVKLESKGKDVELNMGMQLRRQDEGEWQISTQTDSYATGNASSSSTSDTTNNTESTSGAASDVLKRLMEQREKELNK